MRLIGSCTENSVRYHHCDDMRCDALGTAGPTSIVLDDYILEVVDNSTHLGSSISSSLSIDSAINSRIARGTTVMAK
jgi:hypothetical protein